MMSGLITQTLAAKIRQQVQRRGLVVWLDPEEHYGKIIADLDLDGASVERFDGSYFELRHRLEPYLAGQERAQVVAYVPHSEKEARGPLCEPMSAGVVMRPGKQPPVLNTRLAVVARTALSSVVAADVLEMMLDRVESGSLSIDDLEKLVERGPGARTDLLQLVYGTSEPTEVMLRFLSDPTLDSSLDEKKCVPALTLLIEEDLGLVVDPTTPLDVIRASLARHVLVSELVAAAPKHTTAFDDLPHASTGPLLERCIELARTWRNRRDLQSTYAEQADPRSYRNLPLPRPRSEGSPRAQPYRGGRPRDH